MLISIIILLIFMDRLRGTHFSVECNLMMADRNTYPHQKRITYLHYFFYQLCRQCDANINAFIKDTLEWNTTPELLKLVFQTSIFDEYILKPNIFPLNLKTTNHQMLNTASDRLTHSFNNSRDDKLIQYITENIVMSQEIMELMLRFTHNQFGDIIVAYMMKNNVNITNNVIKLCCENQPYMWPVLDYIVSSKYQLTARDFVSIRNLDIMKKVIDMTEIKITEDAFIHFLNLEEVSTEWIKKAELFLKRQQHMVRSMVEQKYIKTYTDQKFEFFVDMGLKITQKSLLESIKKHITLPNIERFNIKINQQELILQCNISRYYPKYNLLGISEEMLEFKNIIYANNTRNLNLFLAKNPKIVPDSHIMKNIATKEVKPSITEKIISLGGIVTFDTLEHCCSKKQSIIIPHFLKSCKKQIQSQLEFLKTLENNVKHNPEMYPNTDLDTITKQITELTNYFNMTNYEQK